jgi:hypothetical protein
MDDNKEKQLKLAEQLQMDLLEDFGKMFKAGSMTPTDRATLYRLLKDGGWVLDPARLPTTLRDKLTSRIDPKQFDEGDPDVPH